MESYLIIGGAGFIGKAYKNFLINNGNKITTTSQNNNNDVDYCFKYTYKNFLNHFKKNSYNKIFFLSGNSYPQYSENVSDLDIKLTNIPLLNILESLKDVKSKSTFWFSSSVAVYGKTNKTLLSEGDVCRPISKYGVSKLMGEEYVNYYSRVYGLNAGSFRIFSTFGPGLKRQVVYDIITKLKHNSKDLVLLGTGQEGRDICYVDNQIERMHFVSQNIKPSGDIYNIGSGQISTVSEIANYIVKILKKDISIKFSNDKRTFDGMQWCADISKIRSLGYTKEEKLYDGLEKTIKEMKKMF